MAKRRCRKYQWPHHEVATTPYRSRCYQRYRHRGRYHHKGHNAARKPEIPNITPSLHEKTWNTHQIMLQITRYCTSKWNLPPPFFSEKYTNLKRTRSPWVKSNSLPLKSNFQMIICANEIYFIIFIHFNYSIYF